MTEISKVNSGESHSDEEDVEEWNPPAEVPAKQWASNLMSSQEYQRQSTDYTRNQLRALYTFARSHPKEAQKSVSYSMGSFDTVFEKYHMWVYLAIVMCLIGLGTAFLQPGEQFGQGVGSKEVPIQTNHVEGRKPEISKTDSTIRNADETKSATDHHKPDQKATLEYQSA
jgi:hypothetical protein